MHENPYASPRAPLGSGPTGNHKTVESLASGQKLVIFAILLNIAGGVLHFVIGSIAALVSIGAFVMSIIGILRLCSGLGYSIGVKILMLVLMIVPLINLITLVILNGKATKILRENGYTVGLFGAWQ